MIYHPNENNVFWQPYFPVPFSLDYIGHLQDLNGMLMAVGSRDTWKYNPNPFSDEPWIEGTGIAMVKTNW